MYSKLVGVFAFGVVAVGVVTTANAQQVAPQRPVLMWVSMNTMAIAPYATV